MDRRPIWRRRPARPDHVVTPRAVPASLVDDAVAAVLADLASTGVATPEAADVVQETADSLSRLWHFAEMPDAFAVAVAEDVQQWLHDTFQDTTWPRCPRHQRHPLWLEHDEGGVPKWQCQMSGEDFGPLGHLRTTGP